MMKLKEAVGQIEAMDEDLTIYAATPWNRDSKIVLATEPDDGSIPDEATTVGAVYFLEVFLAQEFLDGWRSSLVEAPTIDDQCDRLIQYAETDA